MGHLPEDTAIGLVMPSTARIDWFGLYSLSFEALPERSTYCVAI